MGIESITKGIGITYLLLVFHSVRQVYKESEKSQESKLHGSSRKSWISTDDIVSKNAKSKGAKSKTSADQSMGWTREQRPYFLFDSHPAEDTVLHEQVEVHQRSIWLQHPPHLQLA